MSGFRGVSAASDNRFTDKEKKLLKNMKFPKEFDLPVDLKKVNWEVMKTWIAKRVTELLGMEDEVLIGYVYEQLENVKTIDPRLLQINLTGFLEKNTSLFVKAILDEKAEELRKRKEAQDQLNERVDKERKKRSEDDRREREERAKRQEERERQLKKDRERDREREAARQKEREAERQRQRDSEKRRREREAERRKDQEDRDRERGLSSKRPLGDGSASPPAKRALHDRTLQDRTASPAAEPVEEAANGKDSRVRAPDEDRKRDKEKKKEKKSKEDKREKKEKKRLKKEARGRRKASDSPGSDARAEELDRKKSVEEDLRQKALRARQAG